MAIVLHGDTRTQLPSVGNVVRDELPVIDLHGRCNLIEIYSVVFLLELNVGNCFSALMAALMMNGR